MRLFNTSMAAYTVTAVDESVWLFRNVVLPDDIYVTSCAHAKTTTKTSSISRRKANSQARHSDQVRC